MTEFPPTPSRLTQLRRGFDRLRGSTVEENIRPYAEPLPAIREALRSLRTVTDESLLARAGDLRRRAEDGEPLEDLLASTYALVCEASRRHLGLEPYDEQIAAAVALFRAKVVEMQTGEGKTLTAVMPACLRALSGQGLHVLTFNDYLAERDAGWMAPVYGALGLEVGFVRQGMAPAERRRAYGADVTYVTAKEAGFDLLRDLRATETAELVHRPFHAALVDEADSLLIDEARVPLVIAGSVERDTSAARLLAERVAELHADIDFDTDEYARNVEFTEVGFERIENALQADGLLRDGSLIDANNYRLFTELHCALHARALIHRDTDYLVRDGKVVLVDDTTGRAVADRHWPDGLQAALEAKEGLEPSKDGRILGSMTLQSFFGLYEHLAGMTGTARDAAEELNDFYELGVVIVPTHEPCIRIDHPDVVFTHCLAKERALVREIGEVHATGRPILVGTASVEESERLASALAEAAIDCRVLNARNDALEAEIVARAGAPGAVTISTNMAGRGTDIRLGGVDDEGATPRDDRERVVALGGLYVIGTNRHESHRIDRQLRGRAGRQGDPGESRFFVSLEDPLMIRYGLRQLIPERFLPEQSDAPIEGDVRDSETHGRALPIGREINRAQRIIQGQNLEIRRTLWKFAEPIENQRRLFHRQRQALLRAEAEPGIWRQRPELVAELSDSLNESRPEGENSAELLAGAERRITLAQLDRLWSEHLAAAAELRESIHLVGLGGKDPSTQFRLETAESYNQIEDRLAEAVLGALERARVEGGALCLEEEDLARPAATWTYLVNDDPFRSQLASQLTGPGNATLAIGAALNAPIFLILWLLAHRFARQRRRAPGTGARPVDRP